MMGKRAPLKSGDEVDAVESRRFYRWRTGEVAEIKRRIRRRERRTVRMEIRNAW